MSQLIIICNDDAVQKFFDFDERGSSFANKIDVFGE